MSENITTELLYFAHALGWGLILGAIYDIFRISRNIVRHKTFSIFLEDFLYWIFCTFYVFFQLYKIGDGKMRWFALFAIALAMIVYRCSISIFLVKYISIAGNTVKKWLGKLLRFLGRPVVRFTSKTGRFMRKVGRKIRNLIYITKKKLTYLRKLLTITLCKR